MAEMNRLDVISEILSDRFDKTSDKSLIEENNDHTGKKFRSETPITCPPKINYKLYRFDTDVDLFPYFKEKSGLKKMCDYLLFSEYGKEFYVFAIELKKGSASSNKQLKAASVFIKFLVDTAKRIGFEFESDTIEVRTLRICDAAKFKSGTRERGIEYINKHADYRYAELRLQKIMC